MNTKVRQTQRITVRMTPELTAKIDDYASLVGQEKKVVLKRSAAIKRLIERALKEMYG